MTDIFSAFCAILEQIGIDKGIPVGFAGVHFVPPKTGLWLESSVVVGSHMEYGVGADGPTVLRGSFRVGVCDRLGRGAVVVQAMAEQAAQYFHKGTLIGTAVMDEPAEISGLIVDDDRLIVPITIRWRRS